MRFGLVVGIALAILTVAGLTWLSSEHALRTVVAMAADQAGGKLAIEGVTGSLTGEVRAQRVRWQDEGMHVEASEVTVRFSPWSLVQGHIAIAEAHARHLAVALEAGDDGPLAPPESLAPPLAIAIDRLAIDAIAWRHGERTGAFHDLALTYRGNSAGHDVRDLVVSAVSAKLAGDARVHAQRPFDVDAKLVLDLAAPHPAGRVAAQLTGSLEALRAAAMSTLAGIDAQASIELAPFARQPIVAGTLHARAVDLAVLDAAWPATRLDVTVAAKPAPTGFAGTLAVRNDLPGPLDANRVPLAEVAAAFALVERTLSLDAIAATLAGGARLAGRGTIDIEHWQHRWTLDVAALNLARLHSALIDTSLAGKVQADVASSTQRVVAEVGQNDLALAFAATYDGRTIMVERAQAQARGGTLTGRGRVELAGKRPFGLDARADRFDPSRFGAFPAGALSGTIRAQGTLTDTPTVAADVAIAKGSTLVGLPAEGRLRGRFTTAWAEDLDAQVSLGATRLTANGGINRNAPLSIAVASSRLAQLRPLLPQDAPALSGVLDARGRIEPLPKGTRFALDARGEQLAVGAWSFTALRASTRGSHLAPLAKPSLEALADLALDADASGIVTPHGSLAQAKIALAGSAAAHTLAIDAAERGYKLAGRATGALTGLPTAASWRGQLLALAAEGVPGIGRVALVEPTAIDIAAGRVQLGRMRVEGAGTRVDVEHVLWEAGRLGSRGSFVGLPVAALAKAGAFDLPWPMDLVIGGRWEIASTPQWRGVVAIARERGDVYVEDVAGGNEGRVALGLRALQLDATIDGARLAIAGEFTGQLLGTVLVAASAQANGDALHPFARDARLAGTIRGHVPSLATLQPWLGTVARVQGQAIAEINLGGTLADPAFTGQLVGYDLRVDMPQHGVHLAGGRLRIVSSTEGLRLDEFEFGGGGGKFTATGTIALPGRTREDDSASRIAWRAQDFRAINHPDRRLVIDGEGTLAMRQGRWVLAGRVAIDEGTIAWRSTEATTLDDDIVIVGRPRPARSTLLAGGGDAPLDLDLALEFGRNFRFSAEGLDTRLAGKLSIASRRGEPIVGRGTIRAAQGSYEAFGQRLTIDRGRLIFDGPLDNPALDVVALRRNLAVEAGVAITGTARAPVVRLTSNPPVPDSEKLSWLLTGGPPGTATQRELLALQAAQAALAGRGGRTLTQQFARNLGLDDISIQQRDAATTDDPLAGQVVSVGKRITDRLYVSFEQGLAIATNALRIEYVLSRYFTVSAFAGTTSGVELRFRRNWR